MSADKYTVCYFLTKTGWVEQAVNKNPEGALQAWVASCVQASFFSQVEVRWFHESTSETATPEEIEEATRLYPKPTDFQ